MAFSFAIAFAFVTEMPAFGSPCPVHDPAFARLTVVGHSHRTAAASANTHHSSVAVHQHAAAADADQHQQKSHHCTCVGCGSCPSPITLTPVSLTFAPATVSAGTKLPLPQLEKHALSIAEHALPLSTAPPSLIA